MKRFLIFILLLIIIATVAYTTLIPLFPGETLVLKRANGRVVEIDKPGIYVHLPYKEIYVKYRSSPYQMVVMGEINDGSEHYSVSAKITYRLDPVKVFPDPPSSLRLRVSAAFARTLLEKGGNPIALIRNPPRPRVRGIAISSVEIFQIIPSPSTLEIITGKMSRILLREAELLKKETSMKIKEIENVSRLRKEAILQRALQERRNIINNSLEMEGRIVSSLQYPDLWFTLKKMEVYSAADTRTTLYLPLPDLPTDSKRR